MANTPEQFFQAAFDNAINIAIQNEFKFEWSLRESYDNANAKLLPGGLQEPPILIDRAQRYSKDDDLLALVLGRKEYPSGISEELLRIGVTSKVGMRVLNKGASDLERLSAIVTRTTFRDYGNWKGLLEISYRESRGVWITGNSAVDILLRSAEPSKNGWLLEEPGQEAISAVISDSLDQVARYRFFESLVPHNNN